MTAFPSAVLTTPIGPLTVRWHAGGLVSASWTPRTARPGGDRDPWNLQERLAAWFAGHWEAIGAVPLRPTAATPFQRAAWHALQAIPPGERRTYGEVAAALGRPRAARAVGSACARNPLPLWVPCHRVVPARGGIGRYTGGEDRKAALLALEEALATRRAPAGALHTTTRSS